MHNKHANLIGSGKFINPQNRQGYQSDIVHKTKIQIYHRRKSQEKGENTSTK